jgi:hypothetical protein
VLPVPLLEKREICENKEMEKNEVKAAVMTDFIAVFRSMEGGPPSAMIVRPRVLGTKNKSQHGFSLTQKLIADC